MDQATDDDDARAVELETLEAIFPELRRLDEPRFAFEIELPVAPASPITVLFPAASTNNHNLQGAPTAPATVEEDSLQVEHLPPLSCRVVLPDGYPADRAPDVAISTTPQWLSAETLRRLEDDAARLWEEMGRDLIAYAYIDHVQRAADDVFGAVTPEGNLQVHPDHKLAVLDYDIKAKRAAFEKETFECGVCLDPKKGSKCHKMLDCEHVFCLQCLRDFYEDAIQAGSLSTVRCLAPNCAKERAEAATTRKRLPKTFIGPSELLQVGLSDETVRRYVNLKYKMELESDKNTVYCPRRWCSGAARSKKHKKPSDLDFTAASPDHDSDAESESEHEDRDTDANANARHNGPDNDNNKPVKREAVKKFNTADLLCVCEDCGLAFCSRCFQSWHGEFFHCAPRRENGELTEADKASLEYLKLHTSPCPTCNAPAQKTFGCNHMICSRCDSHFCYLCSAWLDGGNPYQHYNQQPNGKVTSCYMRLWELEGGDGDDVGLGFGGGGGVAYGYADEDGGADGEEVDFGDIPELLEAPAGEEEQGDRVEVAGRRARERNGGNPRNGQDMAVAREAPLVLRLMHDNNNQGRGRVAPANRGNAARPRAGAAAGAAAGQGNGHADRPGPGRGGPPRAALRGARGARGGRQRGRANQNQPHHQHQNQHRDEEIIEVPGEDGAAAAEGLDAPMEAWIRRFVQMALADEEDEMDGSDDEHDMIR